MDYKDKTELSSGDINTPYPLSGATIVNNTEDLDFISWQPSTWPVAPDKFNLNFLKNIKKIFDETIISEIENVLEDIKKSNPDGLEHRGHVVGIVLLCAIDAISSYASIKQDRQERFEEFIGKYFPKNYRIYAGHIYSLYRNSMIHSWNLFEAGLLPGNEKLEIIDGTLRFGLLNLFNALKGSTWDMLEKAKTDTDLQHNILNRYKGLRATAKS